MALKLVRRAWAEFLHQAEVELPDSHALEVEHLCLEKFWVCQPIPRVFDF